MEWWQELALDREKSAALYQQLYEQIKKYICSGGIREGNKLPPIRKLASELEVNPATVVSAYEQLADEDLIYKKVGSGSFVAPRPSSGFGRKSEGKEGEASLDMLGYGQIDIRGDINFASATPASSFFPVDDFKKAINSVLDRDGGEAFTYQRSQGYYPLRQSIQSYFSGRGLDLPLDEIHVVSGAQQAIDLLVKTLIDYGEGVLAERPTYPGALSAFRSRAARVDTVRMTSEGMDMDALESILEKGDYRLIYTMTSFQNPTGVSWSEENKERLLQLASEHELVIIEDDCLSELNYEGERTCPLKSLDSQGRVFYIKSFSKVFMPGLRLAFLTIPEKYRSRLLEAKHATDISSAGLTQRAMDYYLRQDMWDEHLENIRELFGRKFSLMKEEIERRLIPPLEFAFQPRGGIYFWLKLPQQVNGDEFYRTARSREVALLPGRVFADTEEDLGSFFRLSFAAVSPREIKRGIARLENIIADMIQQDEGEDEDGYIPLV